MRKLVCLLVSALFITSYFSTAPSEALPLERKVVIEETLSAGDYHSCAVTVDGSVHCWGSNWYGQSKVPSDLGVVTQVTAGGLHSCALTVSGFVRCWGQNGYSQTRVPSDLGVATQVAAGEDHSCALTVSGLVRCWGGINYGQTDVPSDLGAVTQVTAGMYHSCAVTLAGLVRCWGLNYDSQTDVPSDLGVVTQVTGGRYHSCAVTLAGLVRCWGYNPGGNTDVPSNFGVVTQVTAGVGFSCVLTVASLVNCWGSNMFGQTETPKDFAVTQVSAATNYSCAVTVAGLVRCWGYNPVGNTDVPSGLGVVTQVSGVCAVTVAGLVRCWGSNSNGSTDVPSDLGVVTQVSNKGELSCAVTVAGLVRCWGSNSNGQTDVPSDLGEVTQVSAGQRYACAVTVAGLVRCWGSNSTGQTDVPSDLGEVTQVSAGSNHSCAVTVAGLVRCWGYNSRGQTDFPSDLGVVTQVSVFDGQSCAVTVAGLVRCWGSNESGQSNVPSGLGVVTQVSVGGGHVCAVTAAELLRCWGYNELGQADVPSTGYGTIQIVFKQPKVFHIEPLKVEIVGSLTPGSGLTAEFNSGDSRTVYYQWYRNGSKIEGATQATYTIVGEDQGATLTVELLARGANKAVFGSDSRAVAYPYLDISDPSIIGTKTLGSLLTAAVENSDPEVSLSYQWIRNGQVLAGATTRQYSVGFLDLGQNLSVQVTGYKERFSASTRASSVIRISNDIPNSPCSGTLDTTSSWLGTLSQPGITGIPAFGQYLKGSNGVWASGTKFCLFWTADGVVIPKTSTSTLKLDGTSVGKKVQFVVVGIDKSSKRVARVSEPLQVTRASFANVKNPTVRGIAKVGVKLTSSLSSWGSGTSYGYQWLRNSEEISGATASSYVPTAADVGTNLSLRVCGTKPYFEQRCVESVSQVVSLGLISKVGLASVRGTSTNIGVTIFGNTTQWMPGVELSWQWLADGIEIEGATASTYTIARSDRGKTISLLITGYADGYQSVSKVAKYKKIP